MNRVRPRAATAAAVSLVALAACVATRGSSGGALEPRFVAVHNTLAAMGLAQFGPIRQGALAEGAETRVSVDLPAGCTTIVAIGGDGIRDIEATLLDSKGRPIAHDTTSEPEATLRPCLESADASVLVLRAAAGAGTWVAATWAGGVGAAAPAAPTASAAGTARASGTCGSPIPLAAGRIRGSTSRGERENAGSCAQSDSREIVYLLDVAQRERVVIEAEARFDTVLYVRKGDCADPDAEIDCNDDAGDNRHSRIERVLEPGRYFVFVDGYSQEAGPFTLTLTVSDALALADVCKRAPALAPGASVSGATERAADPVSATCGAGADGANAAWRMEIASRSRVRVSEHSDDVAPVVHARRACIDAQSEVACADEGMSDHDVAITGLFDEGVYTVFADARERDATGRYTLQLEVAPPAGTAASAADGCGDAAPLGGVGGTITGDTFAARDDVATSCGGADAPDLVYRVDVAKRSRLVAAFEAEEGRHVASVSRRCGDRSAEVACGRAVDEVLEPGTYSVAVDGAASDQFGRFAMTWSLRDLSSQSSACASAPTLVQGRPTVATTVAAGDRFATSCGSTDAAATGPDRVFRLQLASRAIVRIAVAPLGGGFDAAVALRRSCPDASGGVGAAEIACDADRAGTVIDRALEAGTYWVVVDGQSAADQGSFRIEWRVVR